MNKLIFLVMLGAAAAGPAGCGGHTTIAVSGGTGSGGAGTGAGASTSTSTSGTGASSTTSGTGGTGGVLGTGQCRVDADCMSGFDECLAPGAFAGCGVCFNPPATCTADADCKAQGSSYICEVVGCVCMGQKTCTPGCTSDAMCDTGEACAADNHCGPKPCGSAADCPVDFECAASGCQRKSCSTDATCQGYCVKGACYTMPGTCTPIPA